MYHNFMKGNIVRYKKDGQIMKVEGIRQNPFDNTLSGYIVCSWVNQNGERKTKSFYIDEIDFVSEGNIEPYRINNNINPTKW